MREIARTDKGLTALRIVKYEGGKGDEIYGGCPYGVEYNPNESPLVKGYEKEWQIMGGSVGFYESTFKTLKEATDFFNKGLKGEKDNPEIWLDLLTVKV